MKYKKKGDQVCSKRWGAVFQEEAERQRQLSGMKREQCVGQGVKDWVHMKTAKMMQDFNWFCNLDVNHKLLLIFIIKVVYLCTLHNKIISPAHFVVYMFWQPTPTWFSNKNA